MILNLLIIKNGTLLVSPNFQEIDNASLDDSNIQLVSSFLSAIQIFSEEVTGSSMKTINFKNFTFHFYTDSRDKQLFYVIMTDLDYDQNEINCKILRIASLFFDRYSLLLKNFSGDISPFEEFKNRLIEKKIHQKSCGSPQECMNCPYTSKTGQITTEFIENKDVIISLLKKLLVNLLNNVSEDFALRSALIIGVDGYIIVKQSISEIEEKNNEPIINLVKPITEKIKKFSETSFGSGVFITNEFQLFYIEIGGSIPVLLVLEAESHSNIDNFLPYFYIVAEKISLILHNRRTSLFVPKLLKGGELDLKHKNGSYSGRNLINQIFLIGDERGGKTSLLDMYVNGNFEKDYKPTIGISIFEKELQITKRIKISNCLFDMGGKKNFAKIRKFYYNISNINAILICFDSTRIDNLEKVKEWFDETIKDNTILYVLVGTKIDLIENREEIKEKAEIIANNFKCHFFETSALTGEGIDELFMYISSNSQI